MDKTDWTRWCDHHHRDGRQALIHQRHIITNTPLYQFVKKLGAGARPKARACLCESYDYQFNCASLGRNRTLLTTKIKDDEDNEREQQKHWTYLEKEKENNVHARGNGHGRWDGQNWEEMDREDNEHTSKHYFRGHERYTTDMLCLLLSQTIGLCRLVRGVCWWRTTYKAQEDDIRKLRDKL